MDRRGQFLLSCVIFLWICFFIDLGSCKIIVKPVDTDVFLGESTYLNCSTSNPSVEISWYHCPTGEQCNNFRYVYAYKRIYPPYDTRFRIQRGNTTGSFNLIISKVEQTDAGLYVCENGDEDRQRAQLIVLDPTPDCNNNIQPIGFIGPNNCGLQEESVQLSCRIKYRGNIPPKLNWLLRLKTNATKILPEEVENCGNFSTTVVCNITLELDIHMDGSQLLCETTRSRYSQFYYISDVIKVHHAFSNETQVEKPIGSDIICWADTNSGFCNYTWVWFDGVNDEIVSDEAQLKAERLGWHRCKAECQVKDKSCKFNALLIKAIDDGGKTNTIIPGIIGLLIGATVSGIAIGAVAIVRYCVRRKDKNRLRHIRGKQTMKFEKSTETQMSKSPPSIAELRELETLLHNSSDLKDAQNDDKRTDKKDIVFCPSCLGNDIKHRMMHVFLNQATKLDVNQLSVHLIESRVISEQQWQAIELQQCSNEEKRRLLQSLMIETKNPKLWIDFMDALKQNKQMKPVVKLLNDADVNTGYVWMTGERR